MFITEQMKSDYDVIGETRGGVVVVLYANQTRWLKTTYNSVDEFTEDYKRIGLTSDKVMLLESING